MCSTLCRSKVNANASPRTQTHTHTLTTDHRPHPLLTTTNPARVCHSQAHSLKGGYQKADKSKGDASVNSMLYTLPEQQNLTIYGSSKLRIKFYGGKALGKQARATHMQVKLCVCVCVCVPFLL